MLDEDLWAAAELEVMVVRGQALPQKVQKTVVAVLAMADDGVSSLGNHPHYAWS